jgi:hypothetical protein
MCVSSQEKTTSLITFLSFWFSVFLYHQILRTRVGGDVEQAPEEYEMLRLKMKPMNLRMTDCV